MSNQFSMYKAVMAELKRQSGNYRVIAAESGVAYDTLTKIAYGKIADPGVSKIESLYNYFFPDAVTTQAATDAA